MTNLTSEIRAQPHQWGWVVFVTSLAEHIPAWLKPIFDQAVALDAILINFDPDADICGEFKTYEW